MSRYAGNLRIFCIFLVLGGLSAGLPVPVRADFTITAVQPVAGGTSSRLYGINNVGVGTGESTSAFSNVAQAVQTTSGLGAVTLGFNSGGWSTRGLAINDSNVIVGQAQSYTPSGPVSRAFVYSGSTQGPMTLPGLVANGSATAQAVSNGGVIAGSAVGADGQNHAVTWDLQGNILSLGGFTSGGPSQAFGINSAGKVTGSASTVQGGSQAFLYAPGPTPGIAGEFKNLGALTLNGASQGNAVNNSGHVVGWSASDQGTSHAFAYLNDQMVDLQHSLFNGWNSQALAINNSDWIVGKLTQTGGSSSAFLWTAATGLVNLNSLVSNLSGWTLESATGINDHGQIVGYGLLNGQTRGFILNPVPTVANGSVPEPSSLVLCTLAAATLALGRRFRRRSS